MKNLYYLIAHGDTGLVTPGSAATRWTPSSFSLQRTANPNSKLKTEKML